MFVVTAVDATPSTTMRHRALVLLATGALVLTGCTDEDPAGDRAAAPSAAPTVTASPTATAPPSPAATPPASPSPSPTGELAAVDFTECEADRFSVPYPASWDVNDEGGLLGACRVFSPRGVDLPDEPQGLGLQYAAYVGIDQAPFEDVVDAEVQGEVLLERDETVAGRDAHLLEYRSDGVGLLPEGERSYGWTIDLGDGETLSLSTNSVGETDYDRDKAVVDRMVDELELRDIDPVAGPLVEGSSRQSTTTDWSRQAAPVVSSAGAVRP